MLRRAKRPLKRIPRPTPEKERVGAVIPQKSKKPAKTIKDYRGVADESPKSFVTVNRIDWERSMTQGVSTVAAMSARIGGSGV